jgi:hypothetical protein
MDTLEIVVNGKPALAVAAKEDKYKLTFDGDVPVPDGGWIAARVVGPSSRYVSDSYAFAQTSPVYVVVDGKRWTSAADARFLADVVDAIWARVDGGGRGGRGGGAPGERWRTPAERETFKAAIDRAKAVYLKIAAGSD